MHALMYFIINVVYLINAASSNLGLLEKKKNDETVSGDILYSTHLIFILSFLTQHPQGDQK